jgi:hypothetical protein
VRLPDRHTSVCSHLVFGRLLSHLNLTLLIHGIVIPWEVPLFVLVLSVITSDRPKKRDERNVNDILQVTDRENADSPLLGL